MARETLNAGRRFPAPMPKKSTRKKTAKKSAKKKAYYYGRKERRAKK